MVHVDMGSLTDKVAAKVASAFQDIYATFGKKRDDLSTKAKAQHGFSGKFSATGSVKFPDKVVSEKLQQLK